MDAVLDLKSLHFFNPSSKFLILFKLKKKKKSYKKTINHEDGICSHVVVLWDIFLLNYERLSPLPVLIWLRPNELKTISPWSEPRCCFSITANLIKG